MHVAASVFSVNVISHGELASCIHCRMFRRLTIRFSSFIMTDHDHVRVSQRFIHQTEEELASCDLLQAYEKMWGSSCYVVKAICQRRRCQVSCPTCFYKLLQLPIVCCSSKGMCTHATCRHPNQNKFCHRKMNLCCDLVSH